MATFVSFESNNETSALKSSEYLIERARWQVDVGELLDVLDKRVAVLLTTRQTGKHEYCGAGVSAQAP
jgi:hypothetical protein